jgi:putative solute:sodium symporter small subunit
MDRKFVFCSLAYAIVGLVLGIFMAASKNHRELVTHAHIMLVGFVVSFIYGLCHKLWLNNASSGMAIAQFYIHQLGAAVMSVGLFLLYGNYVALEVIDPVLAISSIAVLVGMVLMAILFAKSCKST